MAINMSLVYNQKMSSEDGASEMMTVEREDAPQWRKNVAALTDRSMLKYYIVALLGASWFFFEIEEQYSLEMALRFILLFIGCLFGVLLSRILYPDEKEKDMSNLRICGWFLLFLSNMSYSLIYELLWPYKCTTQDCSTGKLFAFLISFFYGLLFFSCQFCAFRTICSGSCLVLYLFFTAYVIDNLIWVYNWEEIRLKQEMIFVDSYIKEYFFQNHCINEFPYPVE